MGHWFDFGAARCGAIGFSLVFTVLVACWFGLVGFGLVWLGSVWFGLV